MRILVTGASGFVGGHLAEALAKHGHELTLTAHASGKHTVSGRTYSILACDISDPQAVRSLVKESQPDAVVHLAAVSHVPSANNNRSLLSQVNVGGTHNVCAALAELNRPVTLLFTSTALVYGSSPDGSTSLDESSPVNPNSPYGCSKVAAEYVCRSFESDQFRLYIARPFNHTGPGQITDFVCPAFAERVAKCESGGTIEVGNLAAKRDFTDVRDIVEAYRLILEKKPDEKLFVLGSGEAISMAAVLDHLVSISGKKINTKTNESLLRRNDPPVVLADPSRAENLLGWSRKFSMKETLTDLYRCFSR